MASAEPKEISLNCNQCGNAVAPGAKFCGECGQATSAPSLPPLPPQAPAMRPQGLTGPAPLGAPRSSGLGIAAGLIGLIGAGMHIGGLFPDFFQFGGAITDETALLITEGTVGGAMALSALLALVTGARGRFGAGMVVGATLLMVGLRLDWIVLVTDSDFVGTPGPGFHLQWVGDALFLVAGALALGQLKGGGRTWWARPAVRPVLGGLAVGGILAAGVALPRFALFGELLGSPFDDLGYLSQLGAVVVMAGAVTAGVMAAPMRPGSAGSGIALGAGLTSAGMAASNIYTLVDGDDSLDPAIGLILLAAGTTAFLLMGFILALTGPATSGSGPPPGFAPTTQPPPPAWAGNPPPPSAATPPTPPSSPSLPGAPRKEPGKLTVEL